jgi:hypothetical protein
MHLQLYWSCPPISKIVCQKFEKLIIVYQIQKLFDKFKNCPSNFEIDHQILKFNFFLIVSKIPNLTAYYPDNGQFQK